MSIESSRVPSCARWVSNKLMLVLALGLSAPLGCDGPTNNPDEIDDGLGQGELTAAGPGGIGGITAGMAEADPEVVEAEALLAKGEATQALARIDAAIASNPSNARFYFVRGNALTYLDREAEAEAAYAKAIELDADDPLPHAALGQLIAFRDGASREDKQRAVEQFQVALKLDPKLATAHQSLGVVLIALDQHQLAVEALENADRLAGSAETAYLLAQVHGELGNLQQAIGYAKSAVEYEPEVSGVDLRLLYARLLLSNGQGDDAAREFERVATLVPDAPPLRLEVARGLLELGRPDAAMVHMQWLIETIPEEIPVIVNHGRILVAQGKPKDAIARFDAALAIQSDSRAALTYKIEAQVAAKRCKDARATFDALTKALDWTPADVKAAKPDTLPRALLKAQGYLAGCK
ncbi:tetratricopeptide repeat protein [Enhygromyxa salina]|uniref:Beta-barrel assembly-enhancing protease n=1 Tax=Enhygromyxa salina TaxID=215803 RepID=A0A2S9YQ76_9BACT|nr:tetratricopeptide repeat protein [Enhygromyxa salina]PRQ07222.1 Beta-barrel assembly-enhancing protease [Enhygromyxa salina]